MVFIIRFFMINFLIIYIIKKAIIFLVRNSDRCRFLFKLVLFLFCFINIQIHLYSLRFYLLLYFFFFINHSILVLISISAIINWIQNRKWGCTFIILLSLRTQCPFSGSYPILILESWYLTLWLTTFNTWNICNLVSIFCCWFS
jgi:hypothetical protein